jgi:hypothetical protein
MAGASVLTLFMASVAMPSRLMFAAATLFTAEIPAAEGCCRPEP